MDTIDVGRLKEKQQSNTALRRKQVEAYSVWCHYFIYYFINEVYLSFFNVIKSYDHERSNRAGTSAIRT
jgi:hypothetical protein